MILADPAKGATTTTLGLYGEGLGAVGIPGTVVAVDVFQDGNDNLGAAQYSCTQNVSTGACDPTAVPYVAVGPTAPSLWENPWNYVSGNLR